MSPPSDVHADAAARPPRVAGYETGRLLGFGGSGEVWAATSTESGEPVALKVLRPGADAEALGEGALLRRLDHPHVVRLLDVVEGADGLVLVLERAAGGSLAALVGARGALDPGEVVTILSPLAGALADLHARGLVHGDVSPGNILFADDGRPMLADLGVASMVGLPADAHGTPGYSDDHRKAAPTPDGDVHALAAVGWFALTGQAPPPVDVRAPLVAAAPGAPALLAALVESGLDVRTERRPTASAFAVAAFDAAPALPVRIVPTDPTAVAAEVVTHRLRAEVAGEPPPEVIPTPQWWRRRPVVVALASLAVVLVAGAGLSLAGLFPGDGASVEAASSAAASSPPSGAAAPEVSAPDGASPAGPKADLDEPAGSDPASAVESISRLRAGAFATGEAAPLMAAAAPGSPALADDLRLLADLAQEGLVLSGLAFEVGDVEVLETSDDAARVEVTVTTGAHERLRADDGVVVAQVPESGPVTSELLLRFVDGTWRVEEVLSAT